MIVASVNIYDPMLVPCMSYGWGRVLRARHHWISKTREMETAVAIPGCSSKRHVVCSRVYWRILQNRAIKAPILKTLNSLPERPSTNFEFIQPYLVSGSINFKMIYWSQSWNWSMAELNPHSCIIAEHLWPSVTQTSVKRWRQWSRWASTRCQHLQVKARGMFLNLGLRPELFLSEIS